MTIIETAELLEDYSALINAMLACVESIEPKDNASGYSRKIDFPRVITDALRKFQQYCEIGTVRECKDAMEEVASLRVYIEQLKWERDVAEHQLGEIGLSIGSKMDNVKKAMERYKAEEPVIRKGKYSDEYNCPKCDHRFIYRSTNDDDDEWFCGQRFKFCPACGQTIKWDEEGSESNKGKADKEKDSQ